MTVGGFQNTISFQKGHMDCTTLPSEKSISQRFLNSLLSLNVVSIFLVFELLKFQSDTLPAPLYLISITSYCALLLRLTYSQQIDRSTMSWSKEQTESSPRERAQAENALYVFNRLTRMAMAAESALSTWKQNQVRTFLRHDQVDEILSLSDDFGRTVLDNACISGNLKLVQLLLPKGAKLQKSQVTMMEVCSHFQVLDFLLSEQPDLATSKVVVNSSNNETKTMPLLNFCAKTGNDRSVSILLRHSYKKPESIALSLDEDGNTPLHVARKEDIAAQLLKRAGDITVLRVKNKQGQMPLNTVMERYNTIQRNINFGNKSESLQIECTLAEKILVFYNNLMSRKQTSSHLSANADGRQVAAQTVNSILQRRINSFQPHRSTSSSHQQLLSAVARKRAMQQQHHHHRFPLHHDHQLQMLGGTAFSQHQQEQNSYHQRHLLGGASSFEESIKNTIAMKRQERIKDTAMALSEYGRVGRDRDPRLEQLQQQHQHQHQQQEYLSGMKMNNPTLLKEAAAVAAMTAPVGHMIPNQLSYRIPSSAAPMDSFRFGLAGMRPASPHQDTLQRFSPGGTPLMAAQRTTKSSTGKETDSYHRLSPH